MWDFLVYRRPSTPVPGAGPAGHKEGKVRFEVILSGDFDPHVAGIPERLRFDRCVKDQLMWPLRLKDFMNFLRFDEHSAENLKFYLWYMDYMGRWEKLPAEEKAKSPEWSKETWKEKAAFTKNEPDVTVTEESDAIESPIPSDRSLDLQPFRAEIQRIISIFLLPNSALELNLTGWERTHTLDALARTTSPSAFLPVLQAVEYTLRVQSYANFIIRQLSLNKRNKDRCRIGYVVFTFTLILSITTAVLLILSPFSKAWRLLPAAAQWYGVLAFCSGNRGICALLFVQRATLIDPWDDPEEFATNSVRASKLKDIENGGKSYRIAPTVPLTQDGIRTPANSQNESHSAFEVYFDDFDMEKANERLEDWNTKKPYLAKAFAMNPRVKERGLRKLHIVMFVQHALFAAFCMSIWLTIFMPFPSYGRLFNKKHL